MEPSNDSYSPDAVAEIRQLRQQLQLRDQLVDQLSFELFRAMQSHPPLLAPATADPEAPTTAEARQRPSVPAGPAISTTPKGLRQQVQVLEEQVEFYKQQVDQRDTEINRLQKSCQSLSDRNHVLERMIQELPEVYRQKFADRLEQVKNKLQSLQLENQRLSSQLQGSGSPSGSARQGLSRLLPTSWQGNTSNKT